MSNQKKVYYLAPTWDHAPDGGPIQLGNIVTSPEKPDDPLNGYPHSKPSGDSLYPPNHKHNVTWNKEKHQSGKFGIWTKFLSLFNLDLGTSGESGVDSIYQFDCVETEEFMPRVKYLQEQLAEPLVIQYLETGRPVYMITAIKAVYGAKAKSTKNNADSAQLKTAINGVTSGAPGAIGAELKTGQRNTEGVSFESSSPFVFAFRLRKVIVHKNNDPTTEEYTKRAMYEAAKPQVAEVMPFRVEGLADSDATADEFQLGNGEEVIDDDNEACICVAVNLRV